MKTGLERIVKFTKMLDRFRSVERVLYVPGTDRLENDTEHSYNLAMLAWFIVTTEKLLLDREKVLSYALIHDLAEVYAGDTYIYSDDKEYLQGKAKREHEALLRLKSEFPEADEIFSCIEAYERREDKESRFVYALDKIDPLLHIMNDEGRMWKEKEVTFEMLLEQKKDKVSISPEIREYFEDILGILRSEQERYFK